MTADQAAEYLGIAKPTLYRLIDQGELPAYKMGRLIRLRRVEVDDFLEACRVEPGELAHLVRGEHRDEEEASS